MTIPPSTYCSSEPHFRPPTNAERLSSVLIAYNIDMPEHSSVKAPSSYSVVCRFAFSSPPHHHDIPAGVSSMADRLLLVVVAVLVVVVVVRLPHGQLVSIDNTVVVVVVSHISAAANSSRDENSSFEFVRCHFALSFVIADSFRRTAALPKRVPAHKKQIFQQKNKSVRLHESVNNCCCSNSDIDESKSKHPGSRKVQTLLSEQ
jgi:hypothetical protein